MIDNHVPSQQTQKHLYNICTMLDRRWADVVHILYKCYVFALIWYCDIAH